MHEVHPTRKAKLSTKVKNGLRSDPETIFCKNNKKYNDFGVFDHTFYNEKVCELGWVLSCTSQRLDNILSKNVQKRLFWLTGCPIYRNWVFVEFEVRFLKKYQNVVKSFHRSKQKNT